MDSLGDRLLESYRAERDHLHAQVGHMLALALATLALLQFAVIDSDLYAGDAPRFMGFVVLGLAVSWLAIAPVPQMMVAHANRRSRRWERIKHGWRWFLVPVFSYFLLYLAAVASGSTSATLDGTRLGWLVLAGMVIDLAGFTAMQAWSYPKVAAVLFFPRLFVGVTLAMHGSGLDSNGVTDGERALALYPVFATVVAAQWFVWDFQKWLRRREVVAAVQRLLREHVAGRLPPYRARTLYQQWLLASLGEAKLPRELNRERKPRDRPPGPAGRRIQRARHKHGES